MHPCGFLAALRYKKPFCAVGHAPQRANDSLDCPGWGGYYANIFRAFWLVIEKHELPNGLAQRNFHQYYSLHSRCSHGNFTSSPSSRTVTAWANDRFNSKEPCFCAVLFTVRPMRLCWDHILVFRSCGRLCSILLTGRCPSRKMKLSFSPLKGRFLHRSFEKVPGTNAQGKTYPVHSRPVGSPLCAWGII